jgi:hypothetical protein
MLAAAHLGVMRSHLSLHILAATHPHSHLLLMMLSIHLLLAMHHLLIHAVLALPGTRLVGSFVHSGLVSSNVLIVAVKIFSPAFISGILGPTFFAMLFTAAHSRSLALIFSDVPRLVLSFPRTRALKVTFIYVPRFVSRSCCSTCGLDSLRAFALASAFVFVE